jgi:hypothetical protein
MSRSIERCFIVEMTNKNKKKKTTDDVNVTRDTSSDNNNEQSTCDGNTSNHCHAAHRTPAIVMFDSLRTNSKNRIAATLREFLQLEYDHKKTLPVGSFERKIFNVDTICAIDAAVPQQPNYFDCGLYILQYIERFFAHRSSTIDFRSSATFADWCETTTMGSSKRKQIFDVINQHKIVKGE